MSYLIFCKERSIDGIACWWRADRCGYTSDVNHAGRYSKEEADDICRRSQGEDFPVPEEAFGSSIQTRRIVDVNYGENWRAIDGFQSTAMGKTEGPKP